MSRRINSLVVHCAATYPSMDIGAADIDRWHRDRGWRCIGYHFVIRRDGLVESGRPLREAGAHAYGHNAHSVGICLAGGLQEDGAKEDQAAWEDNFEPTQMDSLVKLLDALLVMFPGADVLGHRDLPGVNKQCPSFNVKPWWAQITGERHKSD